MLQHPCYEIEIRHFRPVCVPDSLLGAHKPCARWNFRFGRVSSFSRRKHAFGNQFTATCDAVSQVWGLTEVCLSVHSQSFLCFFKTTLLGVGWTFFVHRCAAATRTPVYEETQTAAPVSVLCNTHLVSVIDTNKQKQEKKQNCVTGTPALLCQTDWATPVRSSSVAATSGCGVLWLSPKQNRKDNNKQYSY